MTSQRIVLKMDMSSNEKMRKKAMKIASGAHGVRSVSILGQNDQLVLLGEGIDLAELTRKLKKKVCHTSIVAVQPAPPQQPPQPNPMGQHNEMPPARQLYSYNHQMVPPVIYGCYGNEADGCGIL
ncbi:Heavy metal-associated isoprenylated plant protein 41 [Cardamine amara subsp. amara]|uniref:Heavy metal-associated isoprenylated plant protein 41 n=1 Tax=Cardamine amara subsp. amara TaxID=228776 RepID=A0ABD0Z452_CARAN